MPITSTYTTVADYIIDQLWGFASANTLKSDIQYLYERFAGSMEQGTSVGIGGLAISASCGNFTRNAASYADVTNLSVTIITSGRPVEVGLIHDGTANVGRAGVTKTGTTSVSAINGYFKYVRDATDIAEHVNTLTFPADTSASHGLEFSPAALSTKDSVSAGSHTYKLQAKCSSTNETVEILYQKLYAFEI